jgi:hypothetical protein
MIKIERFNGREELDNLLKQFVSIPTNTEIIERTGFSKGAVSGIMNNKIKPSESFIEAFKKGFKITDKKTPSIDNERAIHKDNDSLIKENEFLKQTVKDLLKILAGKQ